MIRLTLALFAALFLAASASNIQCPHYTVRYFSATSHDAAGLEHVIRQYRAALGGDDNLSNAGPIEQGHRSINWDAAAVPFNMPFDFFNTVATRGAIFKAKGKDFAVSNPATPTPQDDRFSSLLPKRVIDQFKRFSLQRLFTPVLKNKVSVLFKVPATNTPATTTGFGAVYTDVDLGHATNMKFFDKNGCLITKIAVSPKNEGLSFAGIAVVDPHNRHKLIPAVSKVVIRLGNISVDDFRRGHLKRYGSNDVVVMDDLIYGEPVAQH